MQHPVVDPTSFVDLKHKCIHQQPGGCETPSCRSHGCTVDPQPDCIPPGVKDLGNLPQMPRCRSHWCIKNIVSYDYGLVMFLICTEQH